MNDSQKRILLVIADAHFRVGLVLFSCALVIAGFGLYQYGQEDPDVVAWCGTVDEPEPLPSGPMDLEYLRGEKLFKANCASCHKPDQKMTGPGLSGSKDRWAQSGGDIYAWIKNSQGYLASSGDSYAKSLFEEWNKSIMTPNAVSNEDIDAILHYIDHYRQPQPMPQIVANARTQGGSHLGHRTW
jgi:mono/diheme cytochrome c family protein